jgi:hypothetical protein
VDIMVALPCTKQPALLLVVSLCAGHDLVCSLLGHFSLWFVSIRGGGLTVSSRCALLFTNTQENFARLSMTTDSTR